MGNEVDPEEDADLNELFGRRGLRAQQVAQDDMDVDMAADPEQVSLAETGGDMDTETDGAYLDVAHATTAADPSPLPSPPQRTTRSEDAPIDVEMDESASSFGEQNRNFMNVPRTPRAVIHSPREALPDHWAIRPSGYAGGKRDIPPYEDLRKNIRLDSMILFDLRLWKQTRIDLRDLYISTVVNVPRFKRVLGLRFAGLYTTLSQLYLVADREPDHSIINLSLQMLTSPAITEEVIERGNFLTNLMAILYTFLTTRQVGFPQDVSPSAVLAFDAGSVTNRRLYHFLADLRYFLAHESVRKRVRTETHYLYQFLDLAKLCQGICPNVRAIGEHVEYEQDAWISASFLTREINKLCRQFAESFHDWGIQTPLDTQSTSQATFVTAYITIVNSVGLERGRFDQCEIKDTVRFKAYAGIQGHPRSLNAGTGRYRVVDFRVEKGAISFHHALHYTLSWLLECGKSTRLSVEILRQAGQAFIDDKDTRSSTLLKATFQDWEDVLLAVFDYPIRVCAWLAQMKAGLWVRNGMSLRHQMGQYKSVGLRDLGHQRDLFMLQTAFVACNPERVLATLVDRFGLSRWISGFDDPVLDFEGENVPSML